jgi:hypothetical protein
VSIKVICLCLLVLSIECQVVNELERTLLFSLSNKQSGHYCFHCQINRADIIVFTVKSTERTLLFSLSNQRFFFLTLDSIAFYHFPLSLETFIFHISEEFPTATTRKLCVTAVSFCFSNKAHLLVFNNLVFFWLLLVFSFQSVVQ